MRNLRFFFGHRLFRFVFALVLFALFYLSNVYAKIYFMLTKDFMRKNNCLKIFCSGGGIGDDLVSLGYTLKHTKRTEHALFICNANSVDCIAAVLKFYNVQNITVVSFDTKKYFVSLIELYFLVLNAFKQFSDYKILVFRMTPVIEWNIFIIPLLFNKRLRVVGYLFGWASFVEQSSDFSKGSSIVRTRHSLYFYRSEQYLRSSNRQIKKRDLSIVRETVTRDDYLVVCPVKTKLWPAGRWNLVDVYYKILDICLSQHITKVKLLGGPYDYKELDDLKTFINSIDKALEVIILYDKSWSEVIGILNGSSYFLGMDNGLSHLASLLELPFIDVIFTFSDADVFASTNMSVIVPHTLIKLPCQPCVGRRWSPTDNSVVKCNYAGYCDKGTELLSIGERNVEV